MNYATIVLVLAILVIITNIFVEIVKSIVKPKNETGTRLIATAVAVVLTVLSFVAYCQIYNIAILWYHLAAAFVVGVVVAYGAIFGFDTLYGQLLDKIKEALTSK